MFWIDIALALVVSVVLSAIFLRFVHARGAWGRPWAFALVVFLFAWAGGVWIAPGLTRGWLTYWVPFLLVGLVTAVLIVAASPRHDLATEEDRQEFHREETAVALSVTVLVWALVAMAVVAIAGGYLR